MPTVLEAIQEAEKRGIPIPDDKKALITEARKRGLAPAPEGAAVPMLPEPSPAQKYGAMAVRVGFPILGGALFGVPGAVGGGAAGEEIAQHILKGTREQPELNQWQVAFQGAINVVPFSKLPMVQSAAGKVLSATGSKVLSAVPEGVVAGTTNVGGSAAAEGRVPTLKEVAFGGALGGAFSSGLSYLFGKFRGTPEQHVQSATESLQNASQEVAKADAQAALADTPEASTATENQVTQAEGRAEQAVTEAHKTATQPVDVPKLPEAKSDLQSRSLLASLKDLSSRWTWQSYAQVLQRRGGGAKSLADVLERADTQGRSLAGQGFTAVQKAIRSLGPNTSEAHARVRDVLDGREPITSLQGPQEEAALKVIRDELAKVRDAARKLGVEREEQGKRALLYTFNPRTGSREPFKGRAADYFPRILKLDARTEGTDLHKRVIQYLSDSMGISADKAETLWSNTLITEHPPSDRLTSRQPNLENGRVGLDLPSWAYEEDMEAVLGSYFPRAYRRLAQVQHLGPDNERVQGLLEVINLEDPELGVFAERGFNRHMGYEKDAHPTLTRIVNATMDATSLSYLSPRSTIRHVAQTVGSGIRTSNTAMVKAFANLRRGGYVKEEYQKAGHMLKEAQQYAWDYARSSSQFSAEQERLAAQTEGRIARGLRKTSETYVKAVGLRGLYDFNRQLAFGSGMMHADQMAGLLAKNPANRKALRELGRLGMDVRSLPALKTSWENMRQVAKHPDFFTDPQRVQTYHATREAYFSRLRDAGTQVMRDVGVENDVLHSPLLFSQREGRLWLQFHLAALKQTKFVWDQVIEQAGKGNMAPLATLSLWGLALGELGADARELMLGRNPVTGQPLAGDEVKTPHGKGGVFAKMLAGKGSAWDVANNYSAIGLSGYVGEAYEQVTSGKRLEYGTFIGAGLEHFVEVINAFKDALQKSNKQGDVEAEPLLEHVLKFDIPVVSPTLGLPLMQQFPHQPGRKRGGGMGGGFGPSKSRQGYIGGGW